MSGLEAGAWLPAALAVRLGSIALALGLVRWPDTCRRLALAGSGAASLLTGALAVVVLASGRSVEGEIVRHPASAFELAYAVGPLSAWFLLVLSVLAVPIAVYSEGYLGHGALRLRSPFAAITFNVLVGAVEMVFAAGGVIGFLFAWELMALANAALVTTEHERRETRRAAFLYLAMSHVATGCLIAAFLIVARGAQSLSFEHVLAGDVATSKGARELAFLLFFAGFGVKAGVIPLHLWLPEAHPAAPSSISALMSGVVIKTGVYGLFRFGAFGLGAPPFAWGMLVLLCGGASAVLGVLYALMQHDLKRLLAYHSIENIGIILLGLGAGMIAVSSGRAELAGLGIAASLLHVLNHAVFKGLLFLGAGGVVAAAGTRQIEEMGGLVRRMPWTALFFLVGALAISGLPPLNGFVSEWLLFQAFLVGFVTTSEAVVRFLFPVAAALLALTSALAAACFVKAFGMTFLALPRGEGARRARESPRLMLVPQGALAIACVVLGLAPGAAITGLRTVLASLPGVRPSPAMVRGWTVIATGPGHFDHLAPPLAAAAVMMGLALATMLALLAGYAVRRSATWGCGGELGARTEYTATAFSKPLMMIFRAVYRPTREVERVGEAYYPRAVTYRSEIEPTFERFVYGPLTRGVLAGAERLKVIQAGSLHAYLAYVLVLGIALLLWLGGGR